MSLLTEIAEGLASLISVAAFVGALLLVADAIIHSPAIVWVHP